ncbi:hypothetical protein L911_3662 [Vibrio fluvialis I21563]|nr:hypothetical protein L911_3662 [Vibrio fluvialis I21563]
MVQALLRAVFLAQSLLPIEQFTVYNARIKGSCVEQEQ